MVLLKWIFVDSTYAWKRAASIYSAAAVEVTTWELPAVFKWSKQAGDVGSAEMGRTFGTGVGMLAVVSKENIQQVISKLEVEGETVCAIWKLVSKGTDGCLLKNLVA
jgi:phosphoribosylamine--glycine ligase/phosphoribosylformylglycinamidine cyclo-ligase